jgi:hypothetical protein
MKERFTGRNLGFDPLDRPGQHTFEPMDRLLETVVAVRGRHAGAGRDVELEGCDRSS